MALLGHPQSMWNAGIRGVVNMCCEYSGPVAAYKEIGMKQLRLPSVDHFEPSLEYMQEAVNFIAAHKKRNEKVYVHCKAGHGRAASIALCWMISEHKDSSLSLEVIIALILFSLAIGIEYSSLHEEESEKDSLQTKKYPKVL
jgi:atypical dual specificity phosphatase